MLQQKHHLIPDRLKTEINDSDILLDEQFGFRKELSTL